MGVAVDLVADRSAYLVEQPEGNEMLALDCETTGLDLRHGAKPFFVSICNVSGYQEWYEWDVDAITRDPRVDKSD